ncbi:MAG: hypothetical protein WD669_12260 [Pirellulales bacterium]
MPVEQLTTRRATSVSSDAQLVQYDQYIDTQIQSTRRTVKLVDLATAIVLLATGVLAYLLAAALVEHWLIPSGFPTAMRMLLFAVLAGGTLYFAYRRLWPLCVRAINPVYAARTIEQSSPSLKNTLVNLLLFRQKRSEVSDAVYHTLEEQAAQRLTRVPVDAAVDRSQLIQLGYVLVGVVAFAAIYKVVSPKDPIISAERVLMPWADIVPASRVRITAVTPGDITIARGEFVDISAEVRGIGDDDPVTLRYTTADGQAVDKVIPMTPAAGGLRFECRLPAAADATGMLGVGQNLSYRITAGDARSLDFRVIVVAAPSILVQRIEYDYPAYTGEFDRSVVGRGDIRAIEGTRVTIHARANGPIDEAHVDFDADGRRDLPMTFDGPDAKASFVLALGDDRQTPRFANYVLRFTNAEGRANREPVKYPIEVLRDYDPEVSLAAPQEKTLDVRLDQTVMIEIDARDPDFALSAVRLHGAAVGRPEIDVPLLSQERPGPFTGRYSFTPKDHQLRAGDIVQYWATASDNRTPTANTAATERRTFRILSSDPAQQPPPKNPPRNDPRRQQGKEAPQEQPGSESQKSNDNQDRTPNREGAAAPGQRQQSPTNPPQIQSEKPNPANDKQDQNNQPTPKNEKANPGDSGQAGGADEEQGKQGQQGQQGQPDQQSQNNQNEQTGAGAAGGAASKEGARPSGARPDSGNSSQPSDGGAQGNPPSQSSPVSPKGDNDSEALHRIQDHLERKGEIKKDNPQNGGSQSPDAKTQPQPSQQPPATRGNNGDRRGGTERPPGESLNDGKQPAQPREGPRSSGDNPTSSNDPSGKGDSPGENQRVRGPQPNAKPDQKWDQTPTPGQSADKPEAGATGRRDPNSAGDQGGDLPEDSKDSAANREVKREGSGGTGQSQSADKGAGEAGERGAGNDSSDPGRDVPAAEKTGQPGSQTPGKGSTQREGQGEQPGGQPNESERNANQRGAARGTNGEPASAGGQSDKQQDPTARGPQRGPRGDSERSNRGSETANEPGNTGQAGTPNRSDGPAAKEGSRIGAPTGSGGQRGTPGEPLAGDSAPPDADAANLEYARKQTDLVLEKLSEQLNRKRVDNELLKKLGWTEDDLRTFVARWNDRKEAARRADPAGDAARRELDDALRSLGPLGRGPLRQSQAKDDNRRDLQPGYRGAVPLEYQERLRAYNQGVSRARRDGGENGK